jgi:hypothetical protein
MPGKTPAMGDGTRSPARRARLTDARPNMTGGVIDGGKAWFTILKLLNIW